MSIAITLPSGQKLPDNASGDGRRQVLQKLRNKVAKDIAALEAKVGPSTLDGLSAKRQTLIVYDQILQKMLLNDLHQSKPPAATGIPPSFDRERIKRLLELSDFGPGGPGCAQTISGFRGSR